LPTKRLALATNSHLIETKEMQTPNTSKLPLIFLVLAMVGCQPKSEVDKCVDAAAVAFKDKFPKAEKSELSHTAYLARLQCLKAQAGTQ
jgi:hypothetical protein